MNITKLNHRIDDIEVKMFAFFLKKYVAYKNELLILLFRTRSSERSSRLRRWGTKSGTPSTTFSPNISGGKSGTQEIESKRTAERLENWIGQIHCLHKSINFFLK